MPTLTNFKRTNGVAGQYQISAHVQHPDEPGETLAFVGNVHGGPIVMVTPRGQTFVSRDVTDRIGSELTPEWIERFFARSTND